MANPTTNFGWQMPTSVDLVTDLPADFEVFGQAVDTDFVGLKGGTTGQVLAKASGTDLDFVWSADAAGMANPMTTTGDIIYSSPGSTPVRLGIGSTDDVLTVAGGVPTWAAPSGGGMDLLATIDASAATGVSFTSINGTYDHLLLIWQGVFQSSTTTFFNIKVNSSSTGYSWMGADISGGSLATAYSGGSSQIGGSGQNAPIPLSPSSNTTADNVRGQIWFYNYANSSIIKRWQLSSVGTTANSSGTTNGPVLTNGIWNNTNAITQIDFERNSSQTITGKFQLWGVK
jgi:hypothetical protein